MQSDELLALAVQQGSEAAMNSLIERYYSPLMRYLYRMAGGQQALAEDLTQEAFLRMMRGIAGYNPQRPFKAWLYTIATNIARNHFTAADTKRSDSMDEDSDFKSDDDLPEAALMQSQDSAAIFDALMKLPEQQRSVLVLFYYEDLPQKEIAEILGIPIGTVKSRLSNSLKRLRELLTSPHPPDPLLPKGEGGLRRADSER
jgi:RNA polymerase sigma-70 factor, ECF subfamily